MSLYADEQIQEEIELTRKAKEHIWNQEREDAKFRYEFEQYLKSPEYENKEKLEKVGIGNQFQDVFLNIPNGIDTKDIIAVSNYLSDNYILDGDTILKNAFTYQNQEQVDKIDSHSIRLYGYNSAETPKKEGDNVGNLGIIERGRLINILADAIVKEKPIRISSPFRENIKDVYGRLILNVTIGEDKLYDLMLEQGSAVLHDNLIMNNAETAYKTLDSIAKGISQDRNLLNNMESLIQQGILTRADEQNILKRVAFNQKILENHNHDMGVIEKTRETVLEYYGKIQKNINLESMVIGVIVVCCFIYFIKKLIPKNNGCGCSSDNCKKK